MPPNTPAGSGSDIQATIDQIKDQLNSLPGFVDDIQSAIDGIKWLLGGALDGIMWLLGKIKDGIVWLAKEIGKFFTEPGVPWTLYGHGSDWTEKIGGRVSALAMVFDADQMQIPNNWQGKAADAYQRMLIRQRLAASGIKSITDGIQTALSAAAMAVIVFWVAVALAITAFIIELTAEGAAAATVVGAPAAAAAGGVSLAKVISVVGTAIGALTYYLYDLNVTQSTLQQRLASNDAFPDSRWPVSVSDISDSSLKNHHAGGWHIKI